jgi:hypothetical protein
MQKEENYKFDHLNNTFFNHLQNILKLGLNKPNAFPYYGPESVGKRISAKINLNLYNKIDPLFLDDSVYGFNRSDNTMFLIDNKLVEKIDKSIK